MADFEQEHKGNDKEGPEKRAEVEHNQQSKLAIELSALQLRAFANGDESDQPATKFDALFLLQAQMADAKSDERKKLKALEEPLINLVGGNVDKVSDTDKEAVLSHVRKEMAKWSGQPFKDDKANVEAELNEKIYKDILDDLEKAIEGKSQLYDNMPPLRPYEYAPQAAIDAAEVLAKGKGELTHLPAFVAAAHEDLDAQRPLYKEAPHGRKTVGAVRKFYEDHPTEGETAVTITFTKEDEPVVKPKAENQENPDGITYTYNPKKDNEILHIFDAYDARQKQLTASKAAAEKLAKGEKIDPQEEFYLMQLLELHNTYIRATGGDKDIISGLQDVMEKFVPKPEPEEEN